MSTQNDVKEFLTKYGQSADQIDHEIWLATLINEMNLGLANEDSGLLMYPSYLTSDFIIKRNVKNVVVDAGGTNFRCCLGYFDNQNRPIFTNLTKSLMPGVKETVSKQVFYDTIAGYIAPLLIEGKDIGFCFSYACDMTAEIDGIVKVLSKEIKAPEVEGTKVGACTLEALRKSGMPTNKIAILNDTVATLLGGIGCTNNSYDSYVGYICGTGTNVSYIEENKNITKLPNLPEGKMVINTEMGGFCNLPQGEFDKVVDKNSSRAGTQIAEKMSSGRYISQIVKVAIAQACYDKLLSEKVKLDVKFFNSSYIGTAGISKYLKGEFEARFSSYFTDPHDIEVVKEICSQIVARAAKVGALLVSACAVKCGKGRLMHNPIGIVAEGSTFLKLSGFRTSFESYLQQILTPKGIYYDIICDQNFNLVGTLAASMVL